MFEIVDHRAANDLTSNFQVYVQGVDVTNERVNEWSAVEDRFLALQETGARYNFGVRVKF